MHFDATRTRKSRGLLLLACCLFAKTAAAAAEDQQTQSTTNAANDDKLDEYLVGAGIADVTGPAAEINLMGYARPSQDSAGIHLRQFCRSIIIEDKLGTRILYLNFDSGMVSQLLRNKLLVLLEQNFGRQTFNASNVMLSATHTHSCPGGYFQYMLYNIPSAGFIGQSLEALLSGAVLSVRRALNSMRPSRIYLHKGELLGASVNRSPTAYLHNPIEERLRYKYNVDTEMTLLRFVETATDQPFAMLNWFPVHGTSMNSSNRLISSDNKGYAALLFEEEFSQKAQQEGDNSTSQANSIQLPNLPGRGKFVAVFAQANEGDVSPNTLGPRCIDTGLPCDLASSTCGNPPRNEKCIAAGPGRDMFESTSIIAHKQYFKARQLFLETQNQKQLRGRVRFVFEHVDMSAQQVAPYEAALRLAASSVVRGRRQDAASANKGNSSQLFTTCPAALGYAFAAGTTDGPGASFDFQQGEAGADSNWDMARNFVKRPSDHLTRCQHPKPILLATGEMDFPYTWHPKVIPTQIFAIGKLAIVGLPGEFTTMSGRRVREAVRATLSGGSVSPPIDGQPPVGGRVDGLAPEEPVDLASDEARQNKAGAAKATPPPSWLSQRFARQPSSRRQKKELAPSATPAYLDELEVALSGLSNIYSSYVATIEEYSQQRYEGASTLYGPHTLQAYVNQFARLARQLVRGDDKTLPPQVEPPDLTRSLFTLKPGVLFDWAPHGKSFGDLLEQFDSGKLYKCSDLVRAVFVSANPRNELRLEQSFLYVDIFDHLHMNWVAYASDASWETKFFWERTSSLLGESRATIEWTIPRNCISGIYRIRHLGSHKNLRQTVANFEGKTMPFRVSSLLVEPSEEGGKVASAATANVDALSIELQQLDALWRLATQSEQSNAAAEVSRRKDLANVASAKQSGSSFGLASLIGFLFRSPWKGR